MTEKPQLTLYEGGMQIKTGLKGLDGWRPKLE